MKSLENQQLRKMQSVYIQHELIPHSSHAGATESLFFALRSRWLITAIQASSPLIPFCLALITYNRLHLHSKEVSDSIKHYQYYESHSHHRETLLLSLPVTVMEILDFLGRSCHNKGLYVQLYKRLQGQGGMLDCHISVIETCNSTVLQSTNNSWQVAQKWVMYILVC